MVWKYNETYKSGSTNMERIIAIMNTDNDLLKNLGKLHTTELGVERIKKICL